MLVSGIIYMIMLRALVAQWIERLVADQKVCAFESRRGCHCRRPPEEAGGFRSKTVEVWRMNPRIIDFAHIKFESGKYGPVFALESDDLDCNLVYWDEGKGIPAHPNDDLDIVGIVLRGEGVLHMDGAEYKLRAGQFFLIPKRVVRELRSNGSEFVYLTVHRRREP